MDARLVRRLRHILVEMIGQAGQHRLETAQGLLDVRVRCQIGLLDREGQLVLWRSGIKSGDLEPRLAQQRGRQRADFAQAEDGYLLEWHARLISRVPACGKDGP